jgi:hypothetical protein
MDIRVFFFHFSHDTSGGWLSIWALVAGFGIRINLPDIPFSKTFAFWGERRESGWDI